MSGEKDENICESHDNKILFYLRDRHQFGFLSNFYKSPFELDHQNWPTVEHFYVASKSRNSEYRFLIRNAVTPHQAKRLGDDSHKSKQSLFRQGFKLRSDWQEVKLDVMKVAVHAKFHQNPTLQKLLVATAAHLLVEDSADGFWGIGRHGSGKNWLGKILMSTRSMLAGNH